MKKEEVLEVPKKIEDQFTYSEAVKNLVAQKKVEFEALQGKITVYKTQLQTLEARLVTLESEHKAKLLAERQKFESERQNKLNELANRDEALRKGEGDYIHRKTDLEAREADIEKINEERKVLLKEKVRYERLNNEAQGKLDEANRKYDEAIKKFDEASKKEAQVDDKLKDATNKLSIVERKEEEQRVKETDIQKQADNLIALRKEVAPQIEELKSLIIKNETSLKELSKKEQVINDKIEQDNKLLDTLTEKDKQLKAKEIALATKEEEILRKGFLLNKDNK